MLGEVDDAHPPATDDEFETMARYLVSRMEVELHVAVVSPRRNARERSGLTSGDVVPKMNRHPGSREAR
jgi:hypothetical protein